MKREAHLSQELRDAVRSLDLASHPLGGTQAVVEAARRIFNLVCDVAERGDDLQALDGYGALIERLTDTTDPNSAEVLARACLNKGVLLGDRARTEEERAAYDVVIRVADRVHHRRIRQLAAVAHLNKGISLAAADVESGALEEFARARTLFEEFEDGDLGQARSRVNSAVLSERIGRQDDANNECREVLRRFADASNVLVQTEVAKALTIMAKCANDDEEAVSIYLQVVQRFGASRAPTLREVVAHALVSAAARTPNHEEALRLCHAVFERFTEPTNSIFIEAAARAMLIKAHRLVRLRRMLDAIPTCRDMVARFERFDSPEVQRQVDAAKRMLSVAGLSPGLT